MCLRCNPSRTSAAERPLAQPERRQGAGPARLYVDGRNPAAAPAALPSE